jgi:hypothetical protein
VQYVLRGDRSRRRRRRSAILLAVAVLGAGTLLTGTASAAPAAFEQRPASCLPDSLCLYVDANYTGAVYRVPGNARTSALGGFQNVASSWFNASGKPFCLIDNSDPSISTILARVLPNTGGNATGGWFGTNDKADFVTDFCPDLR